MKKLLILLTLGLMFGQTRLETRMYISETLYSNDPNSAWVGTINFENLLGPDIEHAVINIIDADINASGSIQFKVKHGTLTYYDGTYSQDIELGKIRKYSGMPIQMVNMGSYVYDREGVDDFIVYKESLWGGQTGDITFTFSVTAEFPIEDTGYMEEDFDFCINEGYNLVSYPCESNIAINDALPSEISNNLSSIVGEGVAGINVNGTWVGSLTQLQAGSGYWFKSSIEACFNYECAEN